jgi:integrase
MSVDLAAAAADWLAGRRARGYRLEDHDWLIAAFLDGLAARGVTTITVADAMAFALARRDTQRVWQATRLRVVRGLAAHVHDLDPAAAELIPAGLIRARTVRRVPYLYSAAQVRELMATTSILSPALVAASIRTLIGLLAATGMRSGEAFALDVEDIRSNERLMMVTGKYGKQRLVPLHATTVAALETYKQVRASAAAPDGPLLVGANGDRLNPNTARTAFRTVVNHCRIVVPPGCRPPRLHDFRHSYAVNTLVDAHRDGDVEARVAALVTVLGHVQAANTYWYLTASPELMAVVAERTSSCSRGRRP